MRSPCPTSVRSAPCATTRPRRRPRRSSSRRPTTSSSARAGAPALARHPANVVRLDLPRDEPGDEPDDRYRRAARTLAAWRSDGTLHKDPHPSIYVYEQTYRVPGTDVERTQRGFFARLRLEPFGQGRACCRTNGRSPARARTATSCSARRASTPARSSALYDDAAARASGSSRADDRGRPTSTWPTTTACAIGCGRCRPTARPRRPSRPLLAPRPRRTAHDRRRPPSLRDGAALSRRAADVAVRARRIRRSTTS